MNVMLVPVSVSGVVIIINIFQNLIKIRYGIPSSIP
jgi:hypothetical protein